MEMMMAETLWVAREGYYDNHAFIGVFSDPDAAKSAVEEYAEEGKAKHRELNIDVDTDIDWIEVRSFHEGKTLYTRYLVHPVTLNERWR
jgi:hypothetical protein